MRRVRCRLGPRASYSPRGGVSLIYTAVSTVSGRPIHLMVPSVNAFTISAAFILVSAIGLIMLQEVRNARVRNAYCHSE